MAFLVLVLPNLWHLHIAYSPLPLPSEPLGPSTPKSAAPLFPTGPLHVPVPLPHPSQSSLVLFPDGCQEPSSGATKATMPHI